MKKYILLSALAFAGCSSHQPRPHITVKLTAEDQSIQMSGFDKVIIADIGRDTSDEAWQSLLPVYKMPADTDMKDFQNAQPGKYSVKDSLVFFTPDTPFQKGQIYFLRAFNYRSAKDAWDFIRLKKQKGSIDRKDLLFKY